MFEAGSGAEGERDAGDEKKLCVAEEILEAGEIGGLQKRSGGGLHPPE